MFRSEKRDIIIPQSEHARLAAIIASHWGNSEFDKPPFDFNSFVEGVALHDSAYGMIDKLELGNLATDKWIDVVEKGAQLKFDNPIVTIIVKLHIKRLIINDEFPRKKEVIETIDTDINSNLKLTNNTLDDFLWVDRITNLCDMAAFNFSFEREKKVKFRIRPKINSTEEKTITVKNLDGGVIKINPWPFSIPEIKGWIYSYEGKEYPEKLVQSVVKFLIIN